MQITLPIKIFLAALVLIALIWLWPSSPDATELVIGEQGEAVADTLVSSIQPIGSANAVAREMPAPEVMAPVVPSAQALLQFERANAAIASGDEASAIRELQDLIRLNPRLIEPYINLASLQAEQGQLDAARKTLLDGVQANPNYATLFANLRKVHGALAANAYQQALAQSEPAVARVELELINSMDASPADRNALVAAGSELASLRTQLQQSSEKASQATSQLASANDRLTELQQQLQQQSQLQDSSATAQRTAVADRDAARARLEELQARLATAQQQVDAQKAELQTREQQYEQQVAALRQQLQAQAELVAAASVPATQQQAPISVALADTAAEPEVQPEPEPARKDHLIARVKSWASAWSSQRVADYVSHYREGYRPPGSSMSHADWLEQRQVRLTNKAFIEVQTSNFNITSVDDSSEPTLAVTFTQRYRSNTMDDTIRKQLRFVARDGDWTQARIISERVIR